VLSFPRSPRVKPGEGRAGWGPIASVVAALIAVPAAAAGIDSRNYSCSALQALIRQHGFVFIGNPDFQDFVVAGEAQCGIAATVQWRSVPTADRPECIVNFCVGGRSNAGGSGS